MARFWMLLAALLTTVSLTSLAAPADAATTTSTSSCTDGGKHLWKGRLDWGKLYTDSHHIRRITAAAVKMTSAAKDATTVDYVVRVYDGSGHRVQKLVKNDKKFDFEKGTAYLDVNPRNPPTAPGRTKITLELGDGNDGHGNCTMTFVEPGRSSSAIPTKTPPVPPGYWPSSPPAEVCGSSALLSGPSTKPAGATTVPAGDNGSVDFGVAGRTYWFAPGTHTLGDGEYDQIRPGAGSTFVGAPGAVLDGKHQNHYAFAGGAKNVTISYLTVKNFDAPLNEGTVNHDSASGWTISHSTITGNGGAGVFLGSGNKVSYSCLSNNSQYGFQVYAEDPEHGVALDHNEIAGNNTGDWESKEQGCGCTGGGKFWDAHDVSVTNNYVHGNHSVGLWADTNNNDFLISGNWISDNEAQAIFWEISYNVAIWNNVVRHNLTEVGPQRLKNDDDSFPDAAIYISESGGDARLPYGLVGSPTVDIAHNLVQDNYNGVALWENADRFCGSPANTSSDYCTLVDTKVAKLSTCNAKTIGQDPFYSDCRWKTQNAKVHDNTFSMDRANFFDCPADRCGANAVFSNYGTYPDWSPYRGTVVQKAITFSQGNLFSDNTYVGEWHFVGLESGRSLTGAQWQAAPYGQDKGSTFTR